MPCLDVEDKKGLVLTTYCRHLGFVGRGRSRQLRVDGGDAGELGRVALGRGALEELDAVLHGFVPDGVIPPARHSDGRVGVAVPAGSALRRGLRRLAAAGSLHGGPGHGGEHDEAEDDVADALEQRDRRRRACRGRAAAASTH